jgi:hypothetical protein
MRKVAHGTGVWIGLAIAAPLDALLVWLVTH